MKKMLRKIRYIPRNCIDISINNNLSKVTLLVRQYTNDVYDAEHFSATPRASISPTVYFTLILYIVHSFKVSMVPLFAILKLGIA